MNMFIIAEAGVNHNSSRELAKKLIDKALKTNVVNYINDPKSTYSAFKATSDHFERVFNNTYGSKTIISNCSNNYDPNQFPEKLISLFINNIRQGKPDAYSDSLITYVTDRSLHDLRYAIDSTKIKNELGRESSLQFKEGVEKIVQWYMENHQWEGDNTWSRKHQNTTQNAPKITRKNHTVHSCLNSK